MNSKDKQYLIAIKSYIELKKILMTKMDYSSLIFILSKISDYKLVDRIINEIQMMNFGKVSLIIDDYLYDNQECPRLFEIYDIKQFDFEYINNVTIDEIKDRLGVERINLYKMKDDAGNTLQYLKHWENDKRFSIVIHEQLIYKIKDNPNINLNVKKELICANLGYYTKFTINEECKEVEYDDDEFIDWNDDPYMFGDYRNDTSENPYIDFFGEGEEANDAYWNKN